MRDIVVIALLPALLVIAARPARASEGYTVQRPGGEEARSYPLTQREQAVLLPGTSWSCVVKDATATLKKDEASRLTAMLLECAYRGEARASTSLRCARSGGDAESVSLGLSDRRSGAVVTLKCSLGI